jgi:hypothetical protein
MDAVEVEAVVRNVQPALVARCNAPKAHVALLLFRNHPHDYRRLATNRKGA